LGEARQYLFVSYCDHYLLTLLVLQKKKEPVQVAHICTLRIVTGCAGFLIGWKAGKGKF
jgi:hypothetical protein